MGLFGLAERAAKLFVKLGLGEIALDIGHFVRKPLPRRLVDVVDVELRWRRCRQSFSACRKGGRASFPPFPPRGPRRSTRISPAAPWCARGCRAPASPGAWSGRRWRRRSPWRRDRPGGPGAPAAAGTRPLARLRRFGSAGCRAWRYSAARFAAARPGDSSGFGSGSMGSPTLDVPAEAEAHGREHLFPESVLAAASGIGRRAPWRARPPGPLPRSRPRRSSDPRRNPGRSRRNPPAADPSPARRRRDRAARTR